MVITKDTLKDLLEQKILQIKFKKKDGTERVMKCTLREDVVPIYEKKTERKKKPNDTVLGVWDLEKDGYRSFCIESLINYSVIEEGYEL